MTGRIPLLTLLSLGACAPPSGEEEAEPRWPGDWTGEDPWAFQGRIDAELCGNGRDDDGDGATDEGCGECGRFVTRTASWWASADTCVLSGEATGFNALPIHLGFEDATTTTAELQSVLAEDPGGDLKKRLRRQLVAARLNARFFGIADQPVVDWTGDGAPETLRWLLQKADTVYGSGDAWLLNVWIEQLREINEAGSTLDLWFDPSCTADPERCNDLDDDGDGLVDESCACIEQCSNALDDDGNGLVDEGCAPCAEGMSRPKAFWAGASCVLDGDAGFALLPITLGASETYSTASSVTTLLAAATGTNAKNRLRHQLLTAKLNIRAFSSGGLPALDWNGDGTVETMQQLVDLADLYFDTGPDWRRTNMATALRTANELWQAWPIWFQPDCSGWEEVCDGQDNNRNGQADDWCGCVETCDGADNDLDSAVDEDFPEVCDPVLICSDGTDAPWWYADADGDGFGDPGSRALACAQPEGFQANAQDCDDLDAERRPSAVDICGDGVDQDCSGDEEGCTPWSSASATRLLGEAAGDEAGWSMASAGDVNDDGHEDLLIGARGQDSAGSNAGAAYLLLGPFDLGGDLELAAADLKLTGATGERAGRAVAGGADLDGDGLPDLVIGAPNAADAGSASGAAMVVFSGSLSGLTGTASLSAADLRITGRRAADYLGSRVATGDLTGDGQADLLLGVTGDSVAATSAGAIYIYAGPLAASTSAVRISSGTWTARITGESAGDQVGLFLATGGDLDGDGIDDILVGSPRQGAAGSFAGATYLLNGPLSGTVHLATADARLLGAEGDRLGAGVSFAGDQDEDGYADFAASAPFEDSVASNAGAVYIIAGRSDLGALNGLAISAAAVARLHGREPSGQLGSSLDASGDHDGDGVLDLLSGANNDGPEARGVTYLFLGPHLGTRTVLDADGAIVGASAEEHLGSFAAFGGDLAGRGTSSLLIGAREADPEGRADAGLGWIVPALE